MSRDKQESTRYEEPNRRNNPENNEDENTVQRGDTVVPAMHHVGPTLESDPDYVEVPKTGFSTPEAQIEAQAGRADVDQRRMEEDDFDPLSGKTFRDRSERLKTRLPGDTSSEPHTDVSPDSPTALQNREDISRKAPRKTE